MSETVVAPQWQRVLEYMERHGSITQQESTTHLGVTRLSPRIEDIERKRGIPIKREWITVRDRFGREARVKKYSPQVQRELFDGS